MSQLVDNVASHFSFRFLLIFFFTLFRNNRYLVVIRAGNNNEAYYSNLPAGNYTFKVKMVGNNSNNTIAEKSILVSIAPEPWNSWWAWCLYLIIMGCVGFVIYRQKMRIPILTTFSTPSRKGVRSAFSS